MSIQAVQIRITFATLGTRIHVYSSVHIFMQPWLIIMWMLSDIIPIIFSLYLNRTFTCITVTITFIQKTNLLMLLERISVSICSHLTCEKKCRWSSLSELNWRAPWKNRISSTSMKLRKSFVKPVTRQNILSCSVLSPEIVMHDAFNVILWTSADICVVVHDDLGWKNWTTRYIFCRVTGFRSDFRLPQTSADICVVRSVKEPNNTL